jgi:hypothetical protein
MFSPYAAIAKGLSRSEVPRATTLVLPLSKREPERPFASFTCRHARFRKRDGDRLSLWAAFINQPPNVAADLLSGVAREERHVLTFAYLGFSICQIMLRESSAHLELVSNLLEFAF